jgi:hypothetical protein
VRAARSWIGASSRTTRWGRPSHFVVCLGGGLRPAKFHEKRLDIAACQNGKAAQ